MILVKAATRLQAVRSDWEGKRGDLEAALTYNRKLWTVLVGAATNPDHPLPDIIRQNIANLGLFIFNHTVALLIDPNPDKLGILVTINLEVANGLRAAPRAA